MLEAENFAQKSFGRIQKKTLELQKLDLKEKKAGRIEAEITRNKVGWEETKVKLQSFKNDYFEIVEDHGTEKVDVTLSQNIQQL